MNEATNILVKEYVEVDGKKADKVNLDDIQLDLVKDLVSQGRSFLDVAEASKVEITATFIGEALLELADAEELKEYSINNIFALAKRNEYDFITLAHYTILQKLEKKQKGEYDEEVEKKIAEDTYNLLVTFFSSSKLDADRSAEISAQSNILRKIILR